jgi:DNA polymerase
MGHGVLMGEIIWGEGPIPCEEMILGEAPGAKEVEEGRPFVGAAGQLLMEALDNAGVGRGDVFITNVYKTRPEGNRNPTEVELREHLHYLVREFLQVRPKKVLLLGRVPSDYFSHLLGINLVRGEFHCSEHGLTYYHAYHPAYTLYNQSAKEEFFAQVYEFFNS